MGKKIGFILIILAISVIMSFVTSCYALEARIGNARMVLRAETGETIEKYIRVINSNNVSVNIELSASGDLEDDIEIVDQEFTLLAGEEKKAYFKINVKKQGTTESNIYVKFIPVDEGNGIGVISTIIVIAEKGSGFFDTGNDDEDDKDEEEGEEEEDEEEEDEKGVNVGSKNPVTGYAVGKKVSFSVMIITISTVVLLVIFIILVVVASLKASKNKQVIKKDVKKGGKIKPRKVVKGYG